MTFVIIAIVVTLAALFFVCRRFRKLNRQRWKEMKAKPLVNASHEQLATLEPMWPVDKMRWPLPYTETEWMDARSAAIYEREARERGEQIQAASTVLLVVAGAVVGLTIQDWVSNFVTFSHHFNPFLAETDRIVEAFLSRIVAPFASPELWLLIGGPLVGIVGLALRHSLLLNFEDIREAYGIAAARGNFSDDQGPTRKLWTPNSDE